MTDGLGRLVADHIRLARIEVVADAQSAGRRLGLAAVFGVLAALGYVLLCVALALFIGRSLGAPWGFIVVGGMNLLIGAVGLSAAVRLLRRVSSLEDTRGELGRSLSAISGAARSPRISLPQEEPGG